MDCNDAAQRMQRFLDGEMGGWQRHAMHRHLDACPMCARGVDFEVALRQMLAAKLRDDPPAGLAERVMGALDEIKLGNIGLGGPGLGEPGAGTGRTTPPDLPGLLGEP